MKVKAHNIIFINQRGNITKNKVGQGQNVKVN